MAQYFTEDTDKSIEKFILCIDNDVKHQIFMTDIKPALDKLVENLIFVYSFYTIDDIETLKKDCLCALYEALPKFKIDRGKKGFSYFNVIAKNWFIQKIREAKKKDKNESELRYDLDHESIKSDHNLIVSHFEEEVEEVEFWKKFYLETDVWKKKLSKKAERQVLDAIMFIMKNTELVSIYNKKAVYLYLRELTGLNSKQIIINLKKIRELYTKWKNHYMETGESRKL